MSKKKFIVTRGLSFSGKSRWANEKAKELAERYDQRIINSNRDDRLEEDAISEFQDDLSAYINDQIQGWYF